MQTNVRAHEIATLLDHAPPGIQVLSLDCFDTLIWRHTNAPTDVFADLPIQGGGIEPRMWAEAHARRHALLKHGRKEIGLAEIYRQMLGAAADDAAVEAAVEHELAIEARHAFAFAPTVALMRAAKARGLKIVLVSDMYLTEAQLRAHIAGAAGEAVLALVDQVFVSNAYGEGKGDKLFAHMLDALRVTPDKVLHIGDNHAADYLAAIEHGLHAVHLMQFDAEATARLRMEAATALMLDPANGISRPVLQVHRAQVALRRSDDRAYALGHDIMGPALHSFALWLKQELDAAGAAAGRPVRPLFVMRDGYLPYRMFDSLFPEMGAATVEISRFVAIRASIVDEAALDHYLEEWLERLPVASLARQLMLFGNEVARFTRQDSWDQRLAFAQWVRTNGEIKRKIFTRRNAFLKKLVAHLHAAGVERGDTVMLVDIGYNGTVQNLLTPVLREAMDLDLVGRYIFLRERLGTGLDKRGMIDARNFDYRTLQALSRSIVVLEQLCNVEQGSTIDFTPEGSPIRESADAKASHNATREVVQQASLDFARASGSEMIRAPHSDDIEARARAAAAIFARLFFLPNASEVAVFETFNFDFNMGSALSDALVNRDRSAQGLRRRGLTFYNEQLPQFMSAELQAQGLPVSLATFTASRFKLDLRSTDFEVGGIPVPVLMATATEQAISEVQAYPTAEGYYHLRIPVGTKRPTIAILFGQAHEWVQIEELSAVSIADFKAANEHRGARMINAVADAMEEHGAGLYRCEANGLLMVPPLAGEEAMLVSLVFRPIVARKAAAELRRAA